MWNYITSCFLHRAIYHMGLLDGKLHFNICRKLHFTEYVQNIYMHVLNEAQIGNYITLKFTRNDIMRA